MCLSLHNWNFDLEFIGAKTLALLNVKLTVRCVCLVCTVEYGTLQGSFQVWVLYWDDATIYRRLSLADPISTMIPVLWGKYWFAHLILGTIMVILSDLCRVNS